jgi:hypothetical protein
MDVPLKLQRPAVLESIYRLFRDYFDRPESNFYFPVVEPILTKLGVTRKELRQRSKRETVVPLAGTNLKP